jgi:outer membrane protein TolC
MKKLTSITLCLVFALCVNAVPASASQNFVRDFLNRYRPTAGVATPAQQREEALTQLIQSGALPLSVTDLINLTLYNNLDINVNRYSPFSSLYAIESLYFPFEPTLTFSGNVIRDTSATTSQTTGALSLSTLRDNFSVGFGQTLQSGTQLAVTAQMNRLSSNSANSTFNPSWTGTLRYSVTQPFLRNFGYLSNTRSIRIAQNNQKISETQFETQVIDIVSAAQKTYWDMVFTAEDIKVKQRSMDLAQKTLTDNQTQVEIGTLAPIDVVQAESEVATRREQLVVSTYTESQIQDQVKKLITNQSDPGLVLARVNPKDTVRNPNPADIMAVQDAIKVALENRPEIRQLKLDLENKKIDTAYTKNQLLPLFNLSASYNQNGVGGTRTERAVFNGPVTATFPGGLTDAFSQLFGYDFTGYSVGFNLQIPLRNRAARADNLRASNEQQLAESRIGARVQQIALEVRNAITQVEMNRARIETAQKARELSERRLDAEQKKFELGASTIRFVLEEQRNVTQAQTNEIAALVNYTKALVDYDKALGMTLKKNNIEVEKALNPTLAQ